MAEAEFYDRLVRTTSFDALCDLASFTPMPETWVVGVCDVVNSTTEVANGRYKTVNMVGAAVISAQINAIGNRPFPFVFGGDGASFAIPPEHADAAEQALRAVQRWALDEFDIGLRAGLVPVHDIRAAGMDIGVARFQASAGADYAMFNGGGVSWAEAALKSGVFGFEPAPRGTVPDLTGLSCRWSPTASQNGTILSLLVQPARGAADARFNAVAAEIITLSANLARGGHPVPDAGPGTQWPPPGVTLEAHARKGKGSLGASRRKILLETLIAWVLFRTGWTIGGFSAGHYARVTGRNSDFRKYDDGLKMTLDCDSTTLAEIKTILVRAQEDGIVQYGLFEQKEAMMTCIVPSVMRDDHIHFVDGAAGGYTQAAKMIKARN
ncbi:hypothetical protein ROLI_025210 [Roseobacter fucihabitans]|uniref:Adenylate cyclase n=1 Tax=Roseobacter fucihabitans TaxID=1537242 RepID=A0ABZ2BU31_9RHOB|nr:DUF3095 domain-containing protein [Roseobacter litoralis]MBC6967977.1 hypothetical protein [Roseobacter litoralis]